MDEATTVVDRLEQDAMDGVLATTRELVEAVLVVEHRLASIAALAEHFGTRYTKRATIELQEATDRLATIEKDRRSAVSRATAFLSRPAETLDELVKVAPEPLRAFLADSRAELVSAQKRIDTLRASAEDVLGRRIALVVEALSTPSEKANTTTYGRPYRPRPRRVSAKL